MDTVLHVYKQIKGPNNDFKSTTNHFQLIAGIWNWEGLISKPGSPVRAFRWVALQPREDHGSSGFLH